MLRKMLRMYDQLSQVAYSVSSPVQWRAREWNNAADLLANVGFRLGESASGIHARREGPHTVS